MRAQQLGFRGPLARRHSRRRPNAPGSSRAARWRHEPDPAGKRPLMTASSSVRLRRAMVASLEESGAVRSTATRDAFLAVPREHFVPELAARDGLASIYRPDVALTTATDNRGVAVSSSSAPAIMAPMLDALRLEPGQRVLEIGAGTGYNAALVKHLVGPRGRVTTVDLETAFARRARRSLARAGYAARVVVGDGRAGWGHGAPYDRIIVTASADEVHRPWLDQLVDGGLIEMPLSLSKGLSYQVVATFERRGELLSSTTAMNGFFMPLRGTVPSGRQERAYKWDGTVSASRGGGWECAHRDSRPQAPISPPGQ